MTSLPHAATVLSSHNKPPEGVRPDPPSTGKQEFYSAVSSVQQVYRHVSSAVHPFSLWSMSTLSSQADSHTALLHHYLHPTVSCLNLRSPPALSDHHSTTARVSYYVHKLNILII